MPRKVSNTSAPWFDKRHVPPYFNPCALCARHLNKTARLLKTNPTPVQPDRTEVKNAIWWGTAADLAREIKTDLVGFVKSLADDYFNTTGEPASAEQQAAWRGSLKKMESVFDTVLSTLTVILEYRLPMSTERCDVIFIGRGEGGRAKAVVLELKGWREARPAGSRLVEADGSLHQHPETQTLGYTGKLACAHSAAERFDIRGCAWLYRLPPDVLAFKTAPVFWRDEHKALSVFLQHAFSGPAADQDVELFLNGHYLQNLRLFEGIKRNYGELRRGMYDALLAKGFSPTSEQEVLMQEILRAVRAKQKVCFLVQGGPGSGKSYLAALLLLDALRSVGPKDFRRRSPAVLAYRNNRLINSVRRVFAECEPGLDAVVQFYATGKKENPGLAGGDPLSPGFQRYDLVIYDEAQRMSDENVNVAMQRGGVMVFFYDEGQILNAEERGRTAVFEEHAAHLNVPIERRHLAGSYRVQGQQQYHAFVQELMLRPDSVKPPGRSGNYEFMVYTDIREMIEELRSRTRLPNTRVALVAAFTESYGDASNKTARNDLNRRVGYPLPSGFDRYKDSGLDIYWLMDEKTQYPDFWCKGESNRLEHCASIYGSQGFEADYVGLIWGRDLVVRQGRWMLWRKYCEDRTGKPLGLRDLLRRAKVKPEDRALAMELLVNRYRIFLTRAIHGTFIYCEDDETGEFLRDLINA